MARRRNCPDEITHVIHNPLHLFQTFVVMILGLRIVDIIPEYIAQARDEVGQHERIGTQRLTERLNGESNNLSLEAWTAEVNDIGEAMKATSACGLGMAAPHVTESLQKFFPDQVASANQ